jgi:hypothetical protein
MNQILYRYQFLLKEDKLILDYTTNNKSIKSINRILIDIERMDKSIEEIRDRYDPDYQKLKKIRELTKKFIT